MASITEKILVKHLVEGSLKPGEEIAITIDQTLTQDATGTMAYLQFESMNILQVKTRLSVSYVDQNMLQTDYRNADDHEYLRSVAAKYGIYFSQPGNGVCHQVHLERFAMPGETLLGSDSHTPTCGGIGMLAIGAGGLDVSVAMGGGPFYLTMPQIIGVELTGELSNWVSAKDVILELLRRHSVKGGVGKIFEFFGEGVKTLSVPERATITNMGAELGLTTSIFPSDEVTKEFMVKQGRGKEWIEMEAEDPKYDKVIKLDLGIVEPLIAKPHSPDNVVPVTELNELNVNQICIGSCTNSSLKDLMTAAKMLEGKKIHPNVSFTVSPGSRQVFEMLAESGDLGVLVNAGARILEPSCGPCIGMGQAPPSKGITLRTFNRNFEGRSGTKDASIYLSSVEVAVASAIKGVITDPRSLGDASKIILPENFLVDDEMIIPPSDNKNDIKVVMGPNIKPVPVGQPLSDVISGKVLLKTLDNVTTDHIMPAGSKILPLRSNIPAISEFTFTRIDPSFPERAKKHGGGFIVGGENYGQGSSREHAALAPMHLGVRAVIAKSFARIHKANLINFGIMPLEFLDVKDYDHIEQEDIIEISNLMKNIDKDSFKIKNTTKTMTYEVKTGFTKRQKEILLSGGLLNYTKAKQDGA